MYKRLLIDVLNKSVGQLQKVSTKGVKRKVSLTIIDSGGTLNSRMYSVLEDRWVGKDNE